MMVQNLCFLPFFVIFRIYMINFDERLFSKLKASDVFKGDALAKSKRDRLLGGMLLVAERYIVKFDIFKLVSVLVKATELDGVAAYDTLIHLLIHTRKMDTVKGTGIKVGGDARTDTVVVVRYGMEHNARKGTVSDVYVANVTASLFGSLDLNSVL